MFPHLHLCENPILQFPQIWVCQESPSCRVAKIFGEARENRTCRKPNEFSSLSSLVLVVLSVFAVLAPSILSEGVQTYVPPRKDPAIWSRKICIDINRWSKTKQCLFALAMNSIYVALVHSVICNIWPNMIAYNKQSLRLIKFGSSATAARWHCAGPRNQTEPWRREKSPLDRSNTRPTLRSFGTENKETCVNVTASYK